MGVFGILPIQYDLGQTLAIAQVDEDHPAVVADGVHPTDQGGCLADLG